MITQLTQLQKKFIEENIDLIEDNNWTKVFEKNWPGVGDVLYSVGIDFMSAIKQVPDFVFSNSTLEEIVIPSKVTKIGSFAFADSNDLKTVKIPSTVSSIGQQAFGHCTSLSNIDIPQLDSLGYGAFYYCTSLRSIDLSECNLKNIYRSTFDHCTSLETVILPDSVEYIDKGAFFNCSALKSIQLPSNITTINKDAFAFCESLTNIMFQGTTADWTEVTLGPAAFNKVPCKTIRCSDGVTRLRH